MDKLSHFTTLKALDAGLVLREGEDKPKLETKGSGGRYMVLTYVGSTDENKVVTVKVSVNEFVKKMKSLSDSLANGEEKFLAEERAAGRSLCKKVIAVKDEKIHGQNLWQKLGTNFKQLNNLFGRDTKKHIHEHKKLYEEKPISARDSQRHSSDRSSPGNARDSQRHSSDRSSHGSSPGNVRDSESTSSHRSSHGSVHESDSVPDLEVEAEDTTSSPAPVKISKLQQKKNEEMEKFVTKVLCAESINQREFDKVSELRDDKGNTVFHLLALSISDNFNNIDHPKIFADLRKFGKTILEVKNNQNKTAEELYREELSSRAHAYIDEEAFGLFSIVRTEVQEVQLEPEPSFTPQQQANARAVMAFAEKLYKNESVDDSEIREALKLRDTQDNTVLHALTLADDMDLDRFNEICERLEEVESGISSVKNKNGLTPRELLDQELAEKEPSVEPEPGPPQTPSPASSSAPAEPEPSVESRVEPGLKEFLSESKSKSAVIEVTTMFLNALSRVQNHPEMKSFDIEKQDDGTIKAIFEFDKATRLDAADLFKKIKKLHPKPFKGITGRALSFVLEGAMKGDLTMEAKVEAFAKKTKNGMEIQFNDQLYIENKGSRIFINKIAFVEDKNGEVKVAFTANGVQGAERTLKGVLKTFEEGSGQKGDNKIQWSKYNNA